MKNRLKRPTAINIRLITILKQSIMKSLKELSSAKLLSKNEQRQIKGGKFYYCGDGRPCPPNYYCDGTICKPDGIPT